jgi:small subunit ribosomal protein S13
MARIHGVVLPDKKQVVYALTLLYGIGFTLSEKILSQAKVEVNKKVNQLSEDELKRIISIIDKEYNIEGDLREEINTNIKALRDIGSYRGIRHIKNLPARGQRTRSNARTKRGKRKTVGALKKEAWAKVDQATQKTAAAEK